MSYFQKVGIAMMFYGVGGFMMALTFTAQKENIYFWFGLGYFCFMTSLGLYYDKE